MNAKLSISQLAEQLLEDKGDMDFHEKSNIQEQVKKAINYYKLNSEDIIEQGGDRPVRTLYIASIAEENMLTKFVQILTNNENITIESVYDGSIIRRH